MAREIPQTPFRFCLYFLSFQKKWLIAGVLLALSVNISIPYALSLIGDIVDILADSETTKDNVWDKTLTIIIILSIVYILGDGLASRLREYCLVFIDRDMNYQIRTEVAHYLMDHPLAYFHDDFSGRLAAKTVDLANNLMRITRVFQYGALDALFMSLATAVLFATVHWSFGLILLIWVIIFTVFFIWTVPKIHFLGQEISEQKSLLTGKLVDILGNISVAKSFANINQERAIYTDQAKAVRKTALQYNIFNAHTAVFKEVMWQLLLAPMVIFIVFQWQNGVVSAGEIAMMIPLLLGIARSVWQLSSSMVDVFNDYGMLSDAVHTIMIPQAKDTATVDLPLIKNGEIAINNMFFNYSDQADRQILFNNLSLTIPAHQKIGLVGSSGAGKSTLVSLLLRFYDIDSGTISIDGQDIAKVTQNSLRKNIAVIPQDTSLFHRTLMENIRYGRLDASDEDVIEAAKKAHIHNFVMQLPDQYETMVGERGVKLSGGQRQRIAIARAILKDAPILILDEATSALDSESEKLIQDSLKTLMEGKTVIAIAHRLSTIAHLDRIIVMDDGKIVEDGTHDELLKLDRHYGMLWGMQSGGFLKAN